MPQSDFNPVFADRPVTIFAVMSALAQKHNAINLGQGFPDEDGPAEIIDFAANAMRNGNNQYTPTMGVPALRKAVAASNQRFYGIELNWETQTLVTSGASEALAASFLGLLNPGDEAILFAPYYDSYAPMVEAAGATPVIIDLEGPEWSLDREKIEAAISPATTLMAINSPHNPLGKTLKIDDLKMLADIAITHDLRVVCDEVYEHIIGENTPHIPLMTLPGMADRCVRIGSAGKTFSLTGWRIGYLSGPADMVSAIAKTRQFLGYTTPEHTQLAVAHGLGFDDSYFEKLASDMRAKRDIIEAGLTSIGFDVMACEGTYFISADIRNFTDKPDHDYCIELTENARVTAIPLSAFYHHKLSKPPTHYIRFCFCKKTQILNEALDRLKRYLTTG